MMLQGLVILHGEGGQKIVKNVRTQVFFIWGSQFLLEDFYSTVDRDFQSSKWLVFNFIVSPNINNLLYDFCTFRFLYFSLDGRFYFKYKKKRKFIIISLSFLFFYGQVSGLSNVLEELQPASKVPRHPNITSEVKDDNSEQLKLSEAQSRRRKRVTFENLVSVHCQSSQAKNETKKEKAVLDGMWATLVTKSSKEDLNKYFENSSHLFE